MSKVNLPFRDHFRGAILAGRKTCTSRVRQYGQEGDTFEVFGRVFALTRVEQRTLSYVMKGLYKEEGFETPEGFRQEWQSIHPRKGFVPNEVVFVHHWDPQPVGVTKLPSPEADKQSYNMVLPGFEHNIFHSEPLPRKRRHEH